MSDTAPAGDAGSPELSGSFEDFTLEELFELFTATRKNGIVTFSEPVSAALWITEGNISYGISPGSAEPRALLARQGIVTTEQFDEALAATPTDGALHETLEYLFDVDPSRLVAVAREQIITTTFEIVVVGADWFEYRSGAVDPLGGVVTMPHDEVLVEAARRRDEWRRIAELIPSTGIVPVLSPTLPDGSSDIRVTADEWQILAQLDGRRSAADVIESLGQSAFEVCGVLYDLLAAGTLEIIDNATDELGAR